MTDFEVAIDKISTNLDELKASMYLELCDRLKNLALQERDYFIEKKIPDFAGKIPIFENSQIKRIILNFKRYPIQESYLLAY